MDEQLLSLKQAEKQTEVSKTEQPVKQVTKGPIVSEKKSGIPSTINLEANIDMTEEEELSLGEEKKPTLLMPNKTVSGMNASHAVSGPSLQLRQRLASGQAGDVLKEQVRKAEQSIGLKFDEFASRRKELDQLAKKLEELDKGGSDSYMEVKTALSDFSEKLGKYRAGDEDSFSAAMEAALRLSEASRGYLETHKGRRKTIGGSAKKQAVKHIHEAVAGAIMDQICAPVTDVSEDERLWPGEITEDMKKHVPGRIAELRANYDSIASAVGGNYLDSTENKIYRRLQIFGIYKDDIRVYRKMHKDDMDPEMKTMFDEYDRLVKQYQLIKWTRKNVKSDFHTDKVNGVIRAEAHYRAEKKEQRTDHEADREYDRQLTAEQLRGIDSIDRWFLRNWNNGGLAGKGLSCLRIGCSDILNELFKRSKRERLHIYYLIETRARKNANILQVGESQSVYVPNLDRFKSQMLATRVSFIKHMTGSYVYMHKLTEAMNISDRYHDVIINTAKLQAQTEKKPEEEKDIPAPVKVREEMLAVFCRNLTDYRNALKACKDAGQEKDGPLVEEAKRLAAVCELNLKGLIAADRDVKEYCKKENLLTDSLKAEQNVVNLEYDEVPDVVKYGGYGTKAVSAAAGKLGKVINPDIVPWMIDGGQFESLKLWGGSISTGFAATGAMLTLMLNIHNLSKYGGSMDDGDRAISVIQIVQSLGKLATGIWSGAESASGYMTHVLHLSTGAKTTVTATSSVAGAAVGGISAVVGLMKMGVNTHRDAKTNSAWEAIMQKRKAQVEELAKGKEKEQIDVEKSEQLRREARYQDSLLGLSDKVHDRGVVSGGFLVGAGLIAIGGVALTAAVSVGGLVVLAAGVAVGVVGGIVDAVLTGRSQRTAFDKFINLPEIAASVREELKKRRGFDVRDEKTFMKQLRRKVCASLGFADVKSACDQISKNTSGFIYDRIFNDKLSDEEKKPYIDMVRSFGLRFDPGKKQDGSDRKPTLKALQKKLSGR